MTQFLYRKKAQPNLTFRAEKKGAKNGGPPGGTAERAFRRPSMEAPAADTRSLNQPATLSTPSGRMSRTNRPEKSRNKEICLWPAQPHRLASLYRVSGHVSGR